MLTVILPAAIKGIKGIADQKPEYFFLTRINRIPITQAKLIAMYQYKDPNTNPIMPEYHTSANPNFFFESTKASIKMDKPITAPAIANQENEFDTTLSVRNARKAKMKAKRGTEPVLKSRMAIPMENSIKRTFTKVSKVIIIFYSKNKLRASKIMRKDIDKL